MAETSPLRTALRSSGRRDTSFGRSNLRLARWTQAMASSDSSQMLATRSGVTTASEPHLICARAVLRCGSRKRRERYVCVRRPGVCSYWERPWQGLPRLAPRPWELLFSCRLIGSRPPKATDPYWRITRFRARLARASTDSADPSQGMARPRHHSPSNSGCACRVPLAPREQRRIVDAIDSYFTRLETPRRRWSGCSKT